MTCGMLGNIGDRIIGSLPRNSAIGSLLAIEIGGISREDYTIEIVGGKPEKLLFQERFLGASAAATYTPQSL